MSRANLIRIVLICVVVLALLLLVRLHVAAAQVPGLGGDPSAGHRLADAWCSECHAIGFKSVGEGKAGPAFTAIANLPSTTGLSLRVFLRTNHRSMPNFIIGQADTDNIVAYILSLKRK